jgi:hypothetical protein
MNQTCPRSRRRVAVPLLAGLGSLALHALLLTHVLLGAWMHARQQPHQGSGVSRQTSSNEAALIVTFIDEPDSTAKPAHASGAIPSVLASPNTFLIPVNKPDAPPQRVIVLSDTSVDEDTASIDAGGNDPGRALMFGRYVNQISARIERAWIRPRTPVESGQFACRARIVQERNGVVREIELEDCNGDAEWQLSLARAIQSASPLPAPPDPTIFTRTLRIEMTSEPFTPGGNFEGFEPESRTAMK